MSNASACSSIRHFFASFWLYYILSEPLMEDMNK
jgi:hypothetical protein